MVDNATNPISKMEKDLKITKNQIIILVYAQCFERYCSNHIALHFISPSPSRLQSNLPSFLVILAIELQSPHPSLPTVIMLGDASVMTFLTLWP